MILLILLWLWSNEDLLNLGFHELLMIGLLIQPIPLELEASIPSCGIDTSRSSHFQLHTRSCQCTPMNRCVWTLRYTHHHIHHSIKNCTCGTPPLSSEPSRLLELGVISSTFGSSVSFLNITSVDDFFRIWALACLQVLYAQLQRASPLLSGISILACLRVSPSGHNHQ